MNGSAVSTLSRSTVWTLNLLRPTVPWCTSFFPPRAATRATHPRSSDTHCRKKQSCDPRSVFLHVATILRGKDTVPSWCHGAMVPPSAPSLRHSSNMFQLWTKDDQGLHTNPILDLTNLHWATWPLGIPVVTTNLCTKRLFFGIVRSNLRCNPLDLSGPTSCENDPFLDDWFMNKLVIFPSKPSNC